MLTRVCRTYGRDVSHRLANGFQEDLHNEMKTPQSSHYSEEGGSSISWPEHGRRVRLLDRWFDLALQQLIHEKRARKESHESSQPMLEGEEKKKDKEEKEEKVKSSTADDNGSVLPIDPIAESSRRLWSSGLVPLHVVAASEAVELVRESEVGSDDTKFAPLANLLQRLYLGMLQSTNDVLALEVARRIRAEKLAKNVGEELTKIKNARAGWKRGAKKVGGRLSVMRMLKQTADREKKLAMQKRQQAAIEMTDEERRKLLTSGKIFVFSTLSTIAIEITIIMLFPECADDVVIFI